MELTQGYKDDFEKKIVDTILSALDQKTITEGDLPQISTFVLEKIDDCITKEEFDTFLEELSIRWKIFESLVTIHKGENQEQKEQEALRGVLQMAKSGNIDQALQLAKSATNVVQQ